MSRAGARGPLQVAMFFTRTDNRLLHTGLSEICDPVLANTPLSRQFDRLDKTITDTVEQLNLAASNVTPPCRCMKLDSNVPASPAQAS